MDLYSVPSLIVTFTGRELEPDVLESQDKENENRCGK